MKIWVGGGKTKEKDVSGFLFIFFIQLNITHYFKSSALLFIICILCCWLHAVLCDKMCYLDVLLQNFRN